MTTESFSMLPLLRSKLFNLSNKKKSLDIGLGIFLKFFGGKFFDKTFFQERGYP